MSIFRGLVLGAILLDARGKFCTLSSFQTRFRHGELWRQIRWPLRPPQVASIQCVVCEKYGCSVFNRGENYTALLPTASSLPRTTPLSKSTLAMLTPRAALPTPSAPTLSAVLSVAKPRLMTPSTAWPRKTAVSVLNHKVAKVTSNADFNFFRLEERLLLPAISQFDELQ